jgi:hypothetical protein
MGGVKSLARAMPYHAGIRPPTASQAECDTPTDFRDTLTDFRDTRRIVATPCTMRCDHGFLPTYLQSAPTTVSRGAPGPAEARA